VAETVTVLVNDTPIGVDDAAGTLVGQPVTVDVLANDIDADDNIDPTTVAIDEQPNNGTVVVDPVTGEVTYTPDPGFVGSDTFVYSFCDIYGACDTAVVTITVSDTNTAPVANDDAEVTLPITPVVIDVVANDSDPEGNLDPATVTVLTGPANGATSVDPVTGEVTYTPDPGFSGTDTFTYEVCDDQGLCDTADVTVVVGEQPVAANDSASTDMATPVVVDVVANDSDGDGVIDPTSVSVTSGPTNGTVVVDPVTGEVTYTPDPGFFGTDVFTYEVCDDDGFCDEATVTVDVNAGPVTIGDLAGTLTDVPVNIDVLANDSDPDGGPLAVTSIPTAPTNGSVVIEPDSTVTYTPDPGFAGVDTFTYLVCDDEGTCVEELVMVTVDGPPVAIDDVAATPAGSAVDIDVLANDNDPEGQLDPATVNVTTGPADGSVVVDPVTGEVTYTPDPGFVGTDTFTYEVCDGAGQCDTATVTVLVDDPLVNDPPVAVDDVDTTDVDTPISIDVAANDVDPDGDSLTVTDVTVAPASGGTAVIEPDGTISYTPGPGFTGLDTFTYEVCDPSGSCDTAEVTVDVNGPPDAVADTTATDPDTPVTIDVLANDSDPDGFLDPTTVAVTVAPANGSTSVDPITGLVTYTPDPGFAGVDTFTYEVCDDDGLCDTATVTVTVPAPPTAVDDSATTDEETPVVIDVVGNDTDVDGVVDPSTVSIVTMPTGGSVSVDPVTGEVTYTPSPGFSGTDTFVYEVCDDDGYCDEATVTVEVNGVPAVADDADQTTENTPVVIDVLANDTDTDGIDPTSVSIASPPANGTVAVDPVTGEITYTPDVGFMGLDAFMYEVCDSLGLCNTASVVVLVDGAPDPVDDTAWTPQDTPVVIDVLANDTDPDSAIDPGSVSVTSGPSNGAVTVDPVTGEVTYTPAPGFYGTDAFTYEVCDTDGACSAADVSVTVDAPPVATDDAASTDVDTPVVVDVLANDTDPDSAIDPGSVSVTSGPSNGAVTVDPVTGEVTYTPAPGFVGTDAFTYEVCDTDGVCADATVTVVVVAPGVDVSGHVWFDADRDGVFDANEDEIPDVVIDLVIPGADEVFGTADDAVLASDATASPYLFEAVGDGPYQLRVDPSTLPAGLFPTGDVDGGRDERIEIVVAGEDVVDQDFGYATASVTGTVIGPDGRPVSGATVVVTDSAGNVFTTVTGPDGTYFIEGTMGTDPLEAGPATIQATLPDGTVVSATVEIVGATTVRQDLVAVASTPATGPSGPLAFTGASTIQLVMAALVMLLAGLLLWGASRPARRRGRD